MMGPSLAPRYGPNHRAGMGPLAVYQLLGTGIQIAAVVAI
jgi:hypothetical protein